MRVDQQHGRAERDAGHAEDVALRDGPRNPESQRREIDEPERHGHAERRMIAEYCHADRRKPVDEDEQQEQAWHDACGARHIKSSRIDCTEIAPSAPSI